MLFIFQRIDKLLTSGYSLFSYLRNCLCLFLSNLIADFSWTRGLALPLDISFMDATELTGSDAYELLSTFDASGSVLTAVPPEVEETCASWK
jgi:hypothetical protein